MREFLEAGIGSCIAGAGCYAVIWSFAHLMVFIGSLIGIV